MAFVIREAGQDDLASLLSLYAFLHQEDPPGEERAAAAWAAIRADSRQHILLGEADGVPAATCVLAILPNLTRNARPYALIENVVTHPQFRGRGHATGLLHHAVRLAEDAGCYKVMLLTGRKDAATLNFYRNAGFDAESKTAFIQHLN